jgi:hypothetical protein
MTAFVVIISVTLRFSEQVLKISKMNGPAE